MTQPEHPSAERISDLLAGVLPAAEAMDVNAHLASCEACRDERAALVDLTSLLADEGATTWEMPSDVAASIDAAIDRASHQRIAGIASLDPAPRTAARRPLRWLAGAAAAVVVVGIGFAGLRALPDQQGADTASKDSAGYAGGAGPSSPPSALKTEHSNNVPQASGRGTDRWRVIHDALTFSSSAQVSDAARRVAATPDLVIAPSTAGCARPITGGLSTVVRYHGHPAVMTITRDTRLVTIYDCATATRTLYVNVY